MKRIIFIFLDGFGLAPAGPDNPLSETPMPGFVKHTGGPLITESSVCKEGVLLKGIDACLDIQGIPQSATGQTALFTGVNSSRKLGYHLPAFPNKELQEIIKKDNLLKRLKQGGKRAIFANSYSEEYFILEKQGKRVHSVTTHCVFSSETPFRNVQDLKAGRAVHWDITRRHSIGKTLNNVEPVTPEEAGTHLASLSKENDLVLFECFLPDMIGHKKDRQRAETFLRELDRFTDALLCHAPEGTTLIISSDHGNIEDLSTGNHTRNPVPLLVLGPLALSFRKAKSITDICSVIYQELLPSEENMG